MRYKVVCRRFISTVVSGEVVVVFADAEEDSWACVLRVEEGMPVTRIQTYDDFVTHVADYYNPAWRARRIRLLGRHLDRVQVGVPRQPLACLRSKFWAAVFTGIKGVSGRNSVDEFAGSRRRARHDERARLPITYGGRAHAASERAAADERYYASRAREVRLSAAVAEPPSSSKIKGVCARRALARAVPSGVPNVAVRLRLRSRDTDRCLSRHVAPKRPLPLGISRVHVRAGAEAETPRFSVFSYHRSRVAGLVSRSICESPLTIA